VVRTMESFVLLVVNCDARQVFYIDGNGEIRSSQCHHRHHHRDVHSSRGLEKSKSSLVASCYRFLTTQSLGS